MSASDDDEFDQYLNELNDIVETSPVDYPDYLDPSTKWVGCHVFKNDNPASVSVSIQRQFHHPAYYILLPPPDSISNYHVTPISNVFWPCDATPFRSAHFGGSAH